MSRFAARVRRATLAQGPTLLLAPATGTYAAGATVTVTIRCQTSIEANAVQANLSYPTARLTFQSIDTSMSPFTTTIESTGGGGSVRIGVGILGGSVSGDVVVGVVTFTAGGAGAAAVSFAAGSGIADAATSSDICQYTLGAAYTIS